MLIIQIDTQELKGEDVESSFGIVEELKVTNMQVLKNKKLLDLIFDEASKEMKKSIKKTSKQEAKKRF